MLTIPFWPGGLGEAVLSAVGQEPGIVVTRLAVSGVPRSGKPQELLDIFGISAKHIAKAVRQTFANWEHCDWPSTCFSCWITSFPSSEPSFPSSAQLEAVWHDHWKPGELLCAPLPSCGSNLNLVYVY